MHQQPEDVAVLVGELIEEEVSPVLTEEIKGHQNVVLGFKAPGSQSQVNGLQQPGSSRQWRLCAVQPLLQVELKRNQTQPHLHSK